MSDALQGWLDSATRTQIHGWAQRGGVTGPIELDIFIAGTLSAPPVWIGRVLANAYRRDRDPRRTLHEGRVGFVVDVAAVALPLHSFFLDIRHDGAPLPGSPRLVPAASFSPAHGAHRVVTVDGRPVPCLPCDILAPDAWRDGTNRVELPPGVCGVALSVPLRDAPGDARRLGVPLFGAAMDGLPLPLESPGFAMGFHASEAGVGGWRWTADVAVIDAGPAAMTRVLSLDLGRSDAWPTVSARLGVSATLVRFTPWDAPGIGALALA